MNEGIAWFHLKESYLGCGHWVWLCAKHIQSLPLSDSGCHDEPRPNPLRKDTPCTVCLWE